MPGAPNSARSGISPSSRRTCGRASRGVPVDNGGWARCRGWTTANACAGALLAVRSTLQRTHKVPTTKADRCAAHHNEPLVGGDKEAGRARRRLARRLLQAVARLAVLQLHRAAGADGARGAWARMRGCKGTPASAHAQPAPTPVARRRAAPRGALTGCSRGRRGSGSTAAAAATCRSSAPAPGTSRPGGGSGHGRCEVQWLAGKHLA